MLSHALTMAAVLAAGLTAGHAGLGVAGQRGAGASGPQGWAEVAWPFSFDAWGRGRAFHCPAGSCGTDLTVFIRPKVGFCNCSAGVADDDEIDRVGDIGLIGEDYRPLRPGAPASLGTMAGRARPFVVNETTSARYALGLAVSKKCDAVVATVVSNAPLSSAGEGEALRFLNGQAVAPWAEASVGLQ